MFQVKNRVLRGGLLNLEGLGGFERLNRVPSGGALNLE